MLASETAAIADLTRSIHTRLESARAVSHPSSEYSAGSWLMTRAYVARVLEGLPLALTSLPRPANNDDPADPPTVDEPGLN